jgi:hypothetical protein
VCLCQQAKLAVPGFWLGKVQCGDRERKVSFVWKWKKFVILIFSNLEKFIKQCTTVVCAQSKCFYFGLSTPAAILCFVFL